MNQFIEYKEKLSQSLTFVTNQQNNSILKRKKKMRRLSSNTHDVNMFVVNQRYQNSANKKI